jgi:glucose-6-phosphate isomerase
MLALSWYLAGNGRGNRMLVVLPYKDRLELFSKYLQQLVMESLGKELDLSGNLVNQGLSVLGNKGATDQHSYVQQLRDGIDNYMAVFVEVMRDRMTESISVEDGVTSGDYLHSFFLGTREALYEKGRKSVTLTVESVDARSVGLLVALFERAVGIYAALIKINAYHQPGVQAGKIAADDLINLKRNVLSFFQGERADFFTVTQIADAVQQKDSHERIFKICKHLVSNGLLVLRDPGSTNPHSVSFRKS